MPASKFYLSLRLFAQILPLQLPALKSCGRRLASLDRVSLSEARSAVGDASPSPKVHCWHQLTRCATAMAETDQKFEANAETLRPSCQLNFIFLEIPFEYKLFFWIADSYFVRYSLPDLNHIKFTVALWLSCLRAWRCPFHCTACWVTESRRGGGSWDELSSDTFFERCFARLMVV